MALKRLLIGTTLVLFLASLVGSQNPIGTLKKARGLQAALYHEASGFRYLEVKYSEIKKEHPKIGFFRLGLPVLKVKDLELNLYPEKASYEKLREKIQGLAESKGTRFILGDPTVLRIISEKKTKIEIKAGRTKISADGTLKCYNGVSVKFGKATRETKSVQLFANDGRRSFSLKTPEGEPIAEISIPSHPKKPVEKSSQPE